MQRDAMVHMEIELAELRARLGINENLSEALTVSRKNLLAASDQRDDLQDKIFGMEARMKSKSDRHERDVAELKLDFSKREAAADAKSKTDKKEMADELRAAAKSLEQMRQEQITMMSARDIARKAEVLSQKNNDDELSFVRSELNAARREVARRAMEDQGKVQPRLDDFAEQRVLEAQLNESHLQNLAMNQSLKDLRLEMLQMHTDNQEAMAMLRAQKSEASPLGMSAAAARRRRQQQQPAANRLPGIDEDDADEIGSTAGSCISAQISACEDPVGDLSDFEDKDSDVQRKGGSGPSKLQLSEQISRLHEELCASESAHRLLEDSAAANEAEHLAKLGRLAAQLLASRDEAAASGMELERLIMSTAESDAAKAGQLLLMTHKLANMQAQQDRNDADAPRILEVEAQLRDALEQLAEAQQSLVFAVESKRMLEIRLADMKQELDATEARHACVVKDLEARLKLAGGFNEAESEVLDRIKAVEEERNVFRNELECQNVHWQAKLEAEQQQVEILQATLAEEREIAEKDHQLRAQVEASLRETKQLLQQARQAQREAEERASNEAAAAKAAIANASVGSLILQLVRCPSRAKPSRPLGTGGVDMFVKSGGGGNGGGNAQLMIWQVVNTMSNVTALLCNATSLKVLEASEKAFSLWGSSAIRGATLTSLVYEQATAAWLQSELTAQLPAFGARTAGVEGFWLRELGCVEFRSKLGSEFDSSVTCARLPEDGPLRPALVLVIVEPLQIQDRMPAPPGPTGGRASAAPSMGRSNRMPGFRRGTPSVTSSVHSEDITANDSVSNVNGRY